MLLIFLYPFSSALSKKLILPRPPSIYRVYVWWGGILGDDKKYNYDGGVIGEKIITQKIYSNQSSHKTISWYIQDNHTIVRHHTNINQSQQKKIRENQKIRYQKSQHLQYPPPNIQKFFRKKN